jgi:hypothetical protein
MIHNDKYPPDRLREIIEIGLDDGVRQPQERERSEP